MIVDNIQIKLNLLFFGTKNAQNLSIKIFQKIFSAEMEFCKIDPSSPSGRRRAAGWRACGTTGGSGTARGKTGSWPPFPARRRLPDGSCSEKDGL
jgi:hypothetical protein